MRWGFRVYSEHARLYFCHRILWCLKMLLVLLQRKFYDVTCFISSCFVIECLCCVLFPCASPFPLSSLFLSSSCPCHLWIPLRSLVSTVLFCSFISQAEDIWFLWSTLKRKLTVFDKSFTFKLYFIALRQIIDEECLFYTSTPPLSYWLVFKCSYSIVV